MKITIDENRNIAYIKVAGAVKSNDILKLFDETVSSEGYQAGMGRLWDFTEVDLSSLEHNLIPVMAQYSTKFPAGIRDVKVAFVVKKSLEYGLTRMFQSYSEIYAKSEVRVFTTMAQAEKWMTANRID